MPSASLFSSALLALVTLLLSSLCYVQPLPLTETADCSSDLLLLTPCLPFANGAAVAPSDTCCDNLANVLRNRPLCVCNSLNQSSSLLVNRSLVLELPRLCRIDLAADTCPGFALAPSASPPAVGPWSHGNSSAVLISPPPPSPRMNSLFLGENWGLKLRVEGTSLALGLMLALAV